MFTIEQVKKLIESMNVGSITESEMDVLAKDTMDKLNESFKEQYDKGKADGLREANESVRKARLESFQRGQEKGKTEITEAVAKAEDIAFKAGRERGIAEAEEEDAEVSKDILDLIEEICIIFDKYVRLVEIVTHEKTKEEFKESFQNALIAFCDKKVNECFPEKEILNYHRLQQLESLNESIKKMYLINDKDVSEAVEEAKQSCKKEFNEAKQAYFNKVHAMHLKNPTMIGFGISNRQTLDSAQANANGAIIGSKFVTLLNESSNADEALDRLFEALEK